MLTARTGQLYGLHESCASLMHNAFSITQYPDNMNAQPIFIAAILAVAQFLSGYSLAAHGQINEPVMLVATPELRDPLFGTTVLVVAPIGDNRHMGFIINRPTSVRLSQMFPNHAPSRQVTDPVYLGGPESARMLFALVRRDGDGKDARFRLADDLYLEIDARRVDGIIENEHDHARFFAGFVIWRPGELDAEIRRNYWFVQEPDTQLVLSKSTAGMWKELVERLARRKNAI